jgi:uncharacterized protein with HEPN domain
MQLELAKYFYDIQHAAHMLASFVKGRTWGDYERDPMLRAATERQFEIIGEALAQLAQRGPSLAGQISEYRQIIAFRNVLIHGYAEVDDRLVWDMAQSRLQTLLQQVDGILASN